MIAHARRLGWTALVAVLLTGMFGLLAGDGSQAKAEITAMVYPGEARVLSKAQLGDRGFSVLQGAGLLRDPGQAFDIDAIAALPPAAFTYLGTSSLRKGFSSDAFWVRLDLRRDEDTPAELLLVTWPPFIDRIDLYAPAAEGGFIRHRAGDHVPVSERMLATPGAVLPLVLDTTAQTWFLRIESSTVITLSVRIMDQPGFIGTSQRRASTQGLHMGMILTAALIAGLAMIWLRQPVFALATGYLLCYLGFQFTFSGYDQILIYPERPWLADNMIGVFAASATALMLWFAVSYLEPQRFMPRLTWLLHGLATFSMGVAIISLTGHYALAAPPFVVVVALAPLFMLVLFLRMLAHARERALAMLLMFAPVIAVTVAQGLHSAGLFGDGEQIGEFWGIATLAQMPVAAVAILLRVREVQRELTTEAGYRMLIENQVDLVLRLNPWRQIEFAGPSCLALFGKSADQLLGSSFLDHVHPADGQLSEAALDKTLQPPNAGYLEARMQSKSGWRWLAWALTTSRDGTGRVNAVIAVGRDISSRVEAEQELAKSQRRLDLALQSGGIGFYDVDVKSRRFEVDDRFLSIIGYQPGEFKLDWDSWQALIHEEDLERVVELTESTIFERGEPLELEYRMRHRDGHWIWMLDRTNIADVDEHHQTVRMVGLIQEITRRKQTELKLGYLVQHDELTGLLNRRGIIAVAQRQHSLCRRDQRPCAFAMADLDHFKRINDELGHEAGDEVLKQVGRLLQGSLREGDWVGRWGGEEFLIVMPLCSLEEAVIGLERARQAIASTSLQVDDQSVEITISIGVTVSQNSELDLDAIVGRADKAMYKAKAGGRNRVSADTGPA